MLNWRIQITIHETQNQNDPLLVNATSFADAKKITIQEIRKRLPSKKNLYLESITKGHYTIVSNFDDVGTVKIDQISE